MIRVEFHGGPADGTTHDYPGLDIALPQLYLIDYASGHTSAVYRRISAGPDPHGRWCYTILDPHDTGPGGGPGPAADQGAP